MSDQDSSDPRHNPDEALRLLKEIRSMGGSPLTVARFTEHCTTSVYSIPDAFQPINWSGKGRKPTKTRAQHSADLRRGMYHTLVRLPARRRNGVAAWVKSGNQTRDKVFPLIEQARNSGTPKRKLCAEVKRLALMQRVGTIPGDWQLRKLIEEFLELSTTT